MIKELHKADMSQVFMLASLVPSYSSDASFLRKHCVNFSESCSISLQMYGTIYLLYASICSYVVSFSITKNLFVIFGLSDSKFRTSTFYMTGDDRETKTKSRQQGKQF